MEAAQSLTTGEAAFRASGCSNMLAFLSTLTDLSWICFDGGNLEFPDGLEFGVDGLRAQEEGREPGSFLRFLTALPSSCHQLWIEDNMKPLASEHELSALCDGIASPSCTLQYLKLKGEITIGSDSAEEVSQYKYGALVGDALCKNTSLPSLTILSHLNMDIIEKHLLPALTRPHSSITSLSVFLAPQHTLDCLLHIFTALALNTVSLHKELWTHNHIGVLSRKGLLLDESCTFHANN